MTLTALPAAAQLPATAQERIAAVESGLMPQTVVRGREPAPATIAQRMERYRVPGVSIAIIHDGKIEWARSYGLADVESKRIVSLETLFQAASMSKPVAAVAALQLVEDGRVSLDEDVNLRLKSWKVPATDFTVKKPVTLRGLLTHTAGLTVHGFRGYAEGETVPTVPELLNGAKPANSAAVRVDIEPGTQWRYSGGGYTVARSSSRTCAASRSRKSCARGCWIRWG
jgi:CubicO group peptidase (beta-lactamase class C family)